MTNVWVGERILPSWITAGLSDRTVERGLEASEFMLVCWDPGPRRVWERDDDERKLRSRIWGSPDSLTCEYVDRDYRENIDEARTQHTFFINTFSLVWCGANKRKSSNHQFIDSFIPKVKWSKKIDKLNSTIISSGISIYSTSLVVVVVSLRTTEPNLATLFRGRWLDCFVIYRLLI